MLTRGPKGVEPLAEPGDVAPQLLDLPEFGQGFISAAPQRFAAVAREFLDR